MEMKAPLGDKKFGDVDVLFRLADVCRPLLSVSRVCDKGDNTITFNSKRAVVKDPKGKVLCVFERKGNLYIGRMKVRNPKHPSFGGQGK